MFHFHTATNDHMATTFRNEGNCHFYCGQFYDAIMYYNRSLCYSKLDKSTDLAALAYGNRSAVYFELREYQKCLDNIDLARKAGFPADKLERLAEREARCLRSLSTFTPDPDNDPSNFFKLSYPGHTTHPYIANCLELVSSHRYGRHIITKQDLKPGDIVALEETPFKSLSRQGMYSRCASCFKTNRLSLLSSPHCAQGKH